MDTNPELSLLEIPINTLTYHKFLKYVLHYNYDIDHKKKLVEYGLRTLLSVNELTQYFPEGLPEGVTMDFRSLTASWELIALFEELRGFLRGETKSISKECLTVFNWMSYTLEVKEFKKLVRKVKKVKLLHHKLGMSLEELKRVFWKQSLNNVKGTAYNLVNRKLIFLTQTGVTESQLLFDLMEYAYLSLNRSLVSPDSESLKHLQNIVKFDLNKKTGSLIKYHTRQKRKELQRVGRQNGKDVFKSTIEFSLDDSILKGEDDSFTMGEVFSRNGVDYLNLLIQEENSKQYGLCKGYA